MPTTTSINIDSIVSNMLAAASNVLKKEWPAVKEYLQLEFEKIAREIMYIETQVALQQMTQEQARLQIKIQRGAAENVLCAVRGLSLLAAENALNAALAAIKNPINAALGFALL